MLSYTMQLSSTPRNSDSFESELTPMAVADYAIKERQKCVLITLKGVILEDGATTMSKFFEDVLALPANRWQLQLKDLRCISGSGLRNLARFVRILRRRGLVVEVIGIHPNVYHMLLDYEVLIGRTDSPFFSPYEGRQIAASLCA